MCYVVYSRATGDDEMCNFYIMYYRDANAHEVTDAACDDEFAHHRFLKFPGDSDTPLIREPTQKSSAETHRIATNRKQTFKTKKKQILKTPSHKLSSVTKTTILNGGSSARGDSAVHHHKVYKKPLHPPAHSSSKYQVDKGWPGNHLTLTSSKSSFLSLYT